MLPALLFWEKHNGTSGDGIKWAASQPAQSLRREAETLLTWKVSKSSPDGDITFNIKDSQVIPTSLKLYSAEN